MSCEFVTKRATEGPCETCGQHGVYARHYIPASHAYLGTVEARCGQGRRAPVHVVGLFVSIAESHAFTEAPEPHR